MVGIPGHWYVPTIQFFNVIGLVVKVFLDSERTFQFGASFLSVKSFRTSLLVLYTRSPFSKALGLTFTLYRFVFHLHSSSHILALSHNSSMRSSLAQRHSLFMHRLVRFLWIFGSPTSTGSRVFVLCVRL